MGVFGLFSKKKEGTLDQDLEGTKQSVFSELSRAVADKSKVNDKVLNNLEEMFVASDVGAGTTLKITERIKQRVIRDRYMSTTELNSILRNEIAALSAENNTEDHKNWNLPADHQPYIILVVGVNGASKATTIDKLACQLKMSGKKVFLGTTNTYHTAAVDQTKIWGGRVDVSVVSQQMEVDSVSVVFDVLQSAKANGTDVALIDTARRLHNKVGLMNELEKIKDVMRKVLPQAPGGVPLVLDDSTRRDVFKQAKQFSVVTQIVSLTTTRLDGTAKGGVVIGINGQLKVSMRYIGLGEQMDDLQLFNRRELIDDLFQYEL